jgi:valyl-tRNA synthetase
MEAEKMAKAYDPHTVEETIIQKWEQASFLNPDKTEGKPFSIVFPPANVTGVLHLGHALTTAIQDTLVRFRRMQGYKTVYIPGTDHAAIATQAKVEAELYKKEKKTRRDFSPEEFLQLVKNFAQESQTTILGQLKRLGASVDWSRLAYTMDDQRSLAVRTAFKKLYDLGLIYRGHRLVNWDPKLQTNVSDEEIQWQEEITKFYYLKYGPFTIGTARPETKIGDKYVVMHPDDKRYAQYKDGDTFTAQWINGPVTATIIKDESIDPEFGSGVMTITPAHDAADYAIAKKHNLDIKPIIDLKGLLMPEAGELAGVHIKKARPRIVEILQAKGLVEKIDEKYIHRIATNSRGGGIIEPQIREQWFVAVEKPFPLEHSELNGITAGSTVTLKQLMRTVVESGQIKIIPGYFDKTYYHWIDNLQDWCISRQIIFGHRIPVWYCGSPAKRMGFAGDVVAQVLDSKTKTYRLRDHGFAVGDTVAFEDSAQKKIFGRGTITEIRTAKVSEIDLQDKEHWKTYNNVNEVIAAFKRHYPEREVTTDTTVWIYTYTFDKNTNKSECGSTIVSVEQPSHCSHCGSNNLAQDPDTLDTWFSSGLWSFSTLGWPQQSPDLKTFHPLSVMETGYDIIFFWVARMILFSTALLGQIPFHHVYLHGLVRDEHRQKMSKSKGNAVDPLEVLNTYGTDALRFALLFANAGGTDMAFSPDRVKGMKHFANKIWNIARYIVRSVDDVTSVSQNPEAKTQADKEILEKLNQTITAVTTNLETFQFHEAAQALYQFTWHELADKYIEVSKTQLTDEGLQENTKAILVHVLHNTLRLLHPFVPFITEHIWGILYPTKVLATQAWPK